MKMSHPADISRRLVTGELLSPPGRSFLEQPTYEVHAADRRTIADDPLEILLDLTM